MRITYIKLTGYIGIYNGLGLNELEIDLSPGTHKITVISGINGCGKSTLLNAMTILPDSSSDFIPDVPAEKRLRIEDGNTIYDICITSAAGKNGSRGASKASIMKNGIELNPNGNIGSYKDIVFDEFELDSNFIALCRLSSDDRGLADKSPAERKKFMNFIIDSLDTYNAIYKNLNKKSSVFKSYINNLHNKIQNIGDEDALRATLSRLRDDAAYIDNYISSLNNEIVAAGTKISTMDTTGNLQKEYEAAMDELNSKRAHKKRDDSAYESAISKLKDKETNLNDQLMKYSNSIDAKEKSLEVSNQRQVQLVDRSEELTKDIREISIRIRNLSSEVDPTIRPKLEKATADMQTEMNNLIDFGLDDIENISVDELQVIFNVINNCLDMIDRFYDDRTEEIIQLSQRYIPEDIKDTQDDIKSRSANKDFLEKQIESISKDIELMSSLQKRPKKCKDDNCPFIKVALDTLNNYSSDPREELNITQQDLDYNNYNLDKSSAYLEKLILAEKTKEDLNRIKTFINTNISILRKVSIGREFVDKFDKYILERNPFNEFRDMDSLNNIIYTFNEYKRAKKLVDYYTGKLNEQSNAEALLNELQPNLDKLQKDKDQIDIDISECAVSIEAQKKTIEDLKKEFNLITTAIRMEAEMNTSNVEFEAAQKIVNDILSKSKECVDLMNRQEECRMLIEEQAQKVAPIKDKIGEYEAQLMMLESYKQDYAMYSKKYDMVEVLKKYSSPTTGIQTVFMDLYMSKTLELANNVLSMIFGGQYRLLDYVINANEFRMPFIGSGMVVDDISSGSTSQVCMMGMVMNLVLKYQASPKYNIASLDEIDGGLDTRNRLEFISVLYKLIDILNIDQLFIISHSLEIELSNVNIIKLKSYDDFGDSPSMDDGCCVLYDFNQTKR